MKRSRGAWWGLAAGFVLGIVGVFSVWAVVVVRGNFRYEKGFRRCVWNLNEIRGAIGAYSERYDDFFPPSLKVLADEGLIAGERLYCPVSGKAYFYGLEGMTVRSEQLPPQCLLLVEQGFPHPYPSPAAVQEAGHRKLYVTYLGGWGKIWADEFVDAFEEQQPEVMMEALRKMLWPDFEGTILPARDDAAPSPSSETEGAESPVEPPEGAGE